MSEQKLKVYLAGGMKSGWQDLVTQAAPQHIYLDPRSHGLKDEKAYTQHDIRAIISADLLFAYMEQGNPAGYNLMFEIGFAVAIKTPVIFVNDNTEIGPMIGMSRSAAAFYTIHLNQGMLLLSQLTLKQGGSIVWACENPY